VVFASDVTIIVLGVLLVIGTGLIVWWVWRRTGVK